jgi:NAD(P)-dependent dehydrogenase (short-subunit alcohol dehydrogenase family)
MKKLENKVAVITGSGSGMGKAIALLFVAEGSKVVATDINQKRLDELKNEIKEKGGEITVLIADMAKEEDIENMIKVAKTTYGTLDILVNNAGIMDHVQPVAEVDNTTWEKVMKVNLDGPFKAMRSALKIFLEKGNGVIINISSIGGLKGGLAGAAYTASKHALNGLTKNTGYMYSKTNIRCNAIAPGAVKTNIGETMDMSKITPLVKERVFDTMQVNPRTGEPSEIAQAALFLACDDSSFMNGHILVVDGGWNAY